MKNLTLRQKRVLAILGLALVLAFWGVVLWLVSKPMMQYLSEPARFRDWIDQYGVAGQLLFVLMVVLQVVIAIIPGEPLEIGAGYAFGIVLGTVLCMIGFLIGSVIIYFLVKKFGRPMLRLFFSEEKIQSLRFVQDSPKRNIILFILMLIPGTPKDLISYIVGLTEIKLPVWLGIVAVSRIPSLITSIVSGDALGMQKYEFAIIVFAVTAVISGVGLLVYQKICKRHEKKKEEQHESLQ